MTSPFYYIDYGIAQLGAVQLWKTSKQNYQKAVEDYIFSLTLGAQRNLPELFKAAGLKFDFSAQFVESLGKILAEQVETSAF